MTWQEALEELEAVRGRSGDGVAVIATSDDVTLALTFASWDGGWSALHAQTRLSILSRVGRPPRPWIVFARSLFPTLADEVDGYNRGLQNIRAVDDFLATGTLRDVPPWTGALAIGKGGHNVCSLLYSACAALRAGDGRAVILAREAVGHAAAVPVENIDAAFERPTEDEIIASAVRKRLSARL